MGNSSTAQGSTSFSDWNDESGYPIQQCCDSNEYYSHRAYPPRYMVADGKVTKKIFSSGDIFPPPPPTTIPTLFRWTRGGQSVQLMGSFDKWARRIPLVLSSEDEFVIIVDLPVGEHQYKYLVDGAWSYDPDEPRVDNGMQSYNNVLTIKETDFEVFKALAVDDNNSTLSDKKSEDKGFSQEVPGNLTAHQRPPAIPPQLLQIVLNREAPMSVDPTILHLPQIAELNHLHALSIKGGVITMSSTHRYKKKYITTVFYQPT